MSSEDKKNIERQIHLICTLSTDRDEMARTLTKFVFDLVENLSDLLEK